MKESRRHVWRNTILGKLLLPIMAILFLQALLYLVVFWQGNILTHMANNAFDILNERVLGRRQYLANEMIHKWSNLSENETRILEQVAKVLEEEGATWQDISRNAALNEKIVLSTAGNLIYLLRKNGVTGAFLVLDGPAIAGESHWDARAGLYLRDLDPGSYAANYEDILMERGMPTVSRQIGLALDSYWTAAFELSPEGTADNERFFFVPLEATRLSDNRVSANYGYWSESFSLSGLDGQVITYSIPLIGDDGTVFGVMGVDITEQQLLSQLHYEEIQADSAGSYLLGVSYDGGHTYRKVCSNGPIYRYRMGTAEEITLSEEIYNGIYRLECTDGDPNPLYGSVSPLKLYNTNSPFEDAQWALIGIVEQDTLLAFVQRIRMLVIVATVSSLLLGLLGVYLASRRVTLPITSLVNELRRSDPNRPIALKKLFIDEIDELTVSIENLSHSVAESASRVSKILSMTKFQIGVFEYIAGNQGVFCSQTLCAVLGWPEAGTGEDVMLEREEFERRMEDLKRYLAQPDEAVFSLPTADGQSRWVQLITQEDKGSVLGAALDVTRDMLVKQKMEYERDYDLLTNLFNRRAFQDKMRRIFQEGGLGVAAMVMWDLDNLKYINDTYGHDYGDRYICALSECLEQFGCYRSVVARRSGDEFYTFIYGYKEKREVNGIIKKVWHKIQQTSIQLPDGSSCRVRASGGIAWYPDDAQNYEELVRFADFAMYSSKRTMKGNLQEFNAQTYQENAFIINGQETLNRLIEDRKVDYALQPIVSARTGKVFGYEMLMRPQGENIQSPVDLLRMAQVHSKLYHIERLSWFEGMRTFVKRAEEGKISPSARVFINSIGSQPLSDGDFAQFVQRFEPYMNRLVLEITESEPANPEYVRKKISRVKQWGGMVAIDDYGTGYNSEASLIFLEPDLVKVDMTIVQNIDRDANRQSVLASLMAYARRRSIKVLAEGVETEQELRTLVSYGVDYLQGFYICRPSREVRAVSPEALVAIRRANRAHSI